MIFLSSIFGGRVSDKIIIQRSGFLDLLEFVDQIMADRGFLVADDICKPQCFTSYPIFHKMKKPAKPEGS